MVKSSPGVNPKPRVGPILGSTGRIVGRTHTTQSRRASGRAVAYVSIYIPLYLFIYSIIRRQQGSALVEHTRRKGVERAVERLHTGPSISLYISLYIVSSGDNRAARWSSTHDAEP